MRTQCARSAKIPSMLVCRLMALFFDFKMWRILGGGGGGAPLFLQGWELQ